MRDRAASVRKRSVSISRPAKIGSGIAGSTLSILLSRLGRFAYRRGLLVLIAWILMPKDAPRPAPATDYARQVG